MLVPFYSGKIFNCDKDCEKCKKLQKTTNRCKKYQCASCGLFFKKGDYLVRDVYEEWITRTFTRTGVKTHHKDCYYKQLGLWLENWEVKHPRKTTGIMGRPKVYSDGKARNRLAALIRYHELKGHTERADQLRKLSCLQEKPDEQDMEGTTRQGNKMVGQDTPQEVQANAPKTRKVYNESFH
jgi:hypothetical protein